MLYDIQDLHFSYRPNSPEILRGINLSIRKGEILTILGRNGAGKSTLMKCLFGIYHMDEGEVYVDGEKVNISNPDEALHKGLAMVHQELQPIPARTIAENMYLSPFYISKIFKSETGDTPIRHLINIRLEKAKELLEDGCAESIQEVAASVGYDDAYHFSKLFKKHYGMTPSQARKKR